MSKATIDYTLLPGYQVDGKRHGCEGALPSSTREYYIRKGIIRPRVASEASEATPQLGLSEPTLTLAGAKSFRWRDSLDGQQQIKHARSAHNQEKEHEAGRR